MRGLLYESYTTTYRKALFGDTPAGDADGDTFSSS
jgi:hypothetical protein